MKSKITVIGIGPGSEGNMTMRAIEALRNADTVVGYNYYIPFISHILKEGAEVVNTGMMQERRRIEKALEIAGSGHDVCVVSSGDSGIYGMAPLVYEMLQEKELDNRIEVEVIPGISAFQKAASLLGAPVGHDFCVISLSDLMTPWALIEKRIKAAVDADFVTAVYNPRSKGRYWELYRLKELFLQGRSSSTPVGYVRQAGRSEEEIRVTDLLNFNPEDVDMFTVLLIGNSQSFRWNERFITPRGYYQDSSHAEDRPGESIMIESFRRIERELAEPDIPVGLKWPLLHAIHTTADFEMEKILKVDADAVERIFCSLTAAGGVRTIITDVTMAASGIRRGALERLGIEGEC